MTVAFWTLVTLLSFTLVGYGMVITLVARFFPERGACSPQALRATLLIAAHNEEGCIEAKLRNALAQDVGPHELTIVVVSDGSTDRTAEIVRACRDPRVSLVEMPGHVGKIAAMQAALDTIGGDVVIFSDANSEFCRGALKALLDRFDEPDVGGVCGALAISKRRSGWLGTAERFYWRYDNAIKEAESRLGGAVSAQGSLYAVRRRLLGPVPTSVADDFYISTQVVAAGYRLVFEPAATTVEAVSGDTRGEFFRRVRSTERGWRGLLARLPLLNPFRTGSYALQLFFHKVLRRMVPAMLLGILILSIPLADRHWGYAAMLVGQALFYGVACGVLIWPALRRVPGVPLAFFFVETQVAMGMGLMRVALGMHSRRWTPVRDAHATSAD